MAAEASECSELRDWYRLQTVIGMSPDGIALKGQTPSGVWVGLKVLWHLSTSQTLREVLKEIWVMTHFCHPCILQLRAVHCLSEVSVCLVTDLLDMTLVTLVRSEPLCSSTHIRLIMYQLLEALYCLNTAGVSHTGVSLNSVLLNTNCDVKLTGFQGVTTYGSPIKPCKWVTRRVPCAGETVACEKVDLWAAGVVFLELLNWKEFSKDVCNSDILRIGRNQIGTETEALSLVNSLLCGNISFRQALTHSYFLPLAIDFEPSNDGMIATEDLARLEKEPIQALRRELSLHYAN